ncbi:MAG: family 16 glycoside hydrolase [Planctomycetota bacterium]
MNFLLQTCLAVQLASVPQVLPSEDVELEQGVSLRVYDVSRELPLMPTLVEGQTPNVSKRVDGLTLIDGAYELDDLFLATADTWLKVDEAGTYEFVVEADDGVILEINDVVVAQGNTSYPHVLQTGLKLEEGFHKLRVTLWEAKGQAIMRVGWRKMNDEAFETIPTDLLFTEADQVRPTSPGPKNVILPDGVDAKLMTAGNGRPLNGVHPYLELTNLRPDGFEPKVGGMTFIDGQLAVCTWDRVGGVYLVGGDEVTKIAEGLAEPLGMFHIDGRTFVLQKQELTELIDEDGDGVTDFYKAAVTGWPTSANFHEFAFGLEGRMTDDGPRLYGALAVAIDPGGRTTVPQVPGRGVVIEMDPDAGTYEVLAQGVRTPNGVGFGVDGELFVLDNQGDWLPESKMSHVPLDGEPRFLGSHMTPDHPWADLVPPDPVVWLPQGEIGNSPTQPTLLPDNWGPYAGDMVHGDVTHGGVKRVFVEEVNGQYQGAVFRFTQGMEAGVNRLLVGPNGDLFVGMIGSTGNWGDGSGQFHGLQKLTPGQTLPFEMAEVAATETGFTITLTKPAAEAFDAEHFAVVDYRYDPTSQYGGPKKDVRDLSVSGVNWNDDRTRVTLDIPDLQPGRVVHLVLVDMADVEGNLPWTTEAWYTLNQVPGQTRAPKQVMMPKLTEAEIADGWKLLFNGRDTAGWHNVNSEDISGAWAATEAGELHLQWAGGGDIVTDETYGDFELSLEWKISEGGNSGIFYRGVETPGEPIFTTALEMQVLDDQRHGDAKNGRDRWAGALYALYAVPDPSPANPAGQWNHAIVRLKDNQLTHILNGAVILETELWGEDFTQRVAESKFASMPGFAKADRGVIGLQDHGDLVWYRNVKIRELD